MPYRWTLTDLNSPYMGSEVLTADPIGWDDGTYTIKRSEIYKGAFHEYTTSLKFHCDGGGKQFVDTVYQTFDIDGRIDVLVEYDCDGSGVYDILFNGIINLASYKTDGEYTTVNIEKSDLLTKLFNREQINVNLETTTSIGGSAISAINTETIVMPSMVIDLHDKWTFESGYYYHFTEDIHGNVAFLFNHSAHAIRADILNTNDWVESSWVYNLQNESTLGQELIDFTGVGIDSPITINYRVKFSGTFTDDESTISGSRRNVNFKLYLMYGVVTDDESTVTFIELYSNGGYTTDNFTCDFDIDQSGTFNLYGGQKVWLVWNLSYDNVHDATIQLYWYYDDNCFITFDTNTTYKTTTAKTVLVHEAFNQVVDAIADSNGNFYSDFLGRVDSQKQTYLSDGCGSMLAITNGLNIREFPDKQIYCNFKELYDDMDCIYNIGCGYENGVIRVEPTSYFYDNNTKIITLPNVYNYTTANDNSRYINKIEIGYQKWESEYHGGLDDVNTKHEYSTAISSVKGIYSKFCKALASSYTIEFTRRKNIEYLETEDWRYDNDNFLISLVRDYGNYRPQLYADSFSDGSGMSQISTAYNLKLTPKRMLLAHLNIITAGIQIIKNAISFVKGDGNTVMSCKKDDVGCEEDYNGEQLAENANISWNDTNAANINPLWLTEKYSFEYPLTYTEFKTIKANPYGYVEFYKFSDDVKAGFILNMEYKMKTGMTKFELLKANV